MNETEAEKAKAIAITTERLEIFLQAARKSEERMKNYLEMQKLKRRLEVLKSNNPVR